MAVSAIISFWGVAALLIAVPGPDWAFAISAGLRRSVLAAAAGIALGYLAMTAVATTGLGLMISADPVALTVLVVVGGVYLIWLGVGSIRRPAGFGESPGAARQGSQILLQGMAVSGLNPKGMLIFVALLPQFADPASAWPVPVQLAVLGLVFVLTCAVAYLAVGSAARALLRTQVSVIRAVSRASGIVMVVFGVLVLAEHLGRA